VHLMAWCVGPTGVQEQGKGTGGFARNLGDPTVAESSTLWRGAATPQSSRLPAGVGPSGTNTGARVGHRRAKENEARRVGRSEVGAPHSSEETGELAQPGPGGAKGALGQGTAGGKHDRGTET